MELPVASTPALTAIRRMAIGASLAGWLLCFLLLIGRPPVHPAVLPTLGLLAAALATGLWGIAASASAATISAVTLLCLLWGWGSQHGGALGSVLLAGMILISAVAWTRRQWSRRIVRMRQVLADLSEEQTVKEQATALVRQARDALQHKHARYAQLQAIAEQLSNMTDLEAIVQLAVERAFALIGKSDVCALFLIDPERQTLSLVASKKREAIPSVRAKHGDQFDRHVLRSHRPLLVDDIRRDFRFTVAPTSERPLSSVIACPLLVGQHAEGVLRLDSAKAGAYTQDDLRFLDILLNLVAVAVTNARLFAQTQQLAMTDGLTGLSLRRPFLEQLARALARAGRSRAPVSLVMIDVDHFKQYNDACGHTAGDLILKQIAETLRQVTTPDAVCARYGGEEFAVLLPRASRADAIHAAEAIRVGVEQRVPGTVASAAGGRRAGFTIRAGTAEPSGVTVSLGVATFPDDAKKDVELLRIADQRLYEAKHAGRNRVVAGGS